MFLFYSLKTDMKQLQANCPVMVLEGVPRAFRLSNQELKSRMFLEDLGQYRLPKGVCYDWMSWLWADPE